MNRSNSITGNVAKSFAAWWLYKFRTSKYGRTDAAYDSTQRHGTTGATGVDPYLLKMCLFFFLLLE